MTLLIANGKFRFKFWMGIRFALAVLGRDKWFGSLTKGERKELRRALKTYKKQCGGFTLAEFSEKGGALVRIKI